MARQHIQRVQTHHRTGAVDTGDVANNYNGTVALSAAADTTCTDADTWYLVQGTFSAEFVEGFTVVAAPTPGLCYDGGFDQNFRAEMSASMKVDAVTASTTLYLGVGIDGMDPADDIKTPRTVAITTENHMSAPFYMTLEENNVVSFYVKAADAGSVVTFSHFTGGIAPLERSPV